MDTLEFVWNSWTLLSVDLMKYKNVVPLVLQTLINNSYQFSKDKCKSHCDCCCQKKGLFMATSCSSFNVCVIVALNKRVCRFLGNTLNIVSNCSPKSSSISRSASSNTWNYDCTQRAPQKRYNNRIESQTYMSLRCVQRGSYWVYRYVPKLQYFFIHVPQFQWLQRWVAYYMAMPKI